MVYIVFPVFICIFEIIFTFSKSINATDSVFYVFSIVYAGIQFGAFINFFITQMGLLKKMRSRRQLKKVFDDLKQQVAEADERDEGNTEEIKKVKTRIE